MNRIAATAFGMFLTLMLPLAAHAAPLVAKVDISAQTMTVIYNGQVTYQWPVSTARQGKYTPRGSWTAKWLSRHHRSSLYNNAPMPYSIFFSGNYAIHGTDQIHRLGRPASAGCVRLHPQHAATLFNLTQQVGKRNMRVVIQN
jgi:lipoprotein-anchoring transpeptidase ErfK/SrfK